MTKRNIKRFMRFSKRTREPLWGRGFSWRETTFQEKLDWVKERQREEVERLAEARKPLEDEIRALNEFLREKYEEVDKIELRASESLSELSEAEGYINTLEKRSNALESKIRAFESENLRLAQQNTRLTDLKIMSEGEGGSNQA